MKTIFVVLFKSFYNHEGIEYPITSDTRDIKLFESLVTAINFVSDEVKLWQNTGYESLPYWQDVNSDLYFGGQRVQNGGTAAVWEVREIPVQ